MALSIRIGRIPKVLPAEEPPQMIFILLVRVLNFLMADVNWKSDIAELDGWVKYSHSRLNFSAGFFRLGF